MPSLKRGVGLSFDGSNWNLVSDGRWELHPVYVPNHFEKFVGTRKIYDQDYSVFICSDDGFLAQPTSICEAPDPEDDLLNVCLLEHLGRLEEGKAVREKKIQAQSSGTLIFSGTNWKLAGESKWSSFRGFLPSDLGEMLGSREIGKFSYDVFNAPGGGFIAVRQ